MGKARALETIAEAVVRGRKSKSLLGDVDASGAKIAPLGGGGRVATDIPVLPGIDNLGEYQKVANKLDEATSVPAKPADVRAEIARREEEQFETARLTAIDPKNTKADLDMQARTPEEFIGRVEQMRNQEYAVSSINASDIFDNMANPFDALTKHEDRYTRWAADAAPVHRVINTSPELKAWAGEGVYTRGGVYGADVADPDSPAIFFRMDIKTDPRGDLSPIQFDAAAREFGMHVGSKQAGMDIVSPQVRSIDKKRAKAIESMFDDLAAPLREEGIDPKVLYKEALDEVRTNLFLRHGEQPFSTPSVDILNEVIDDFFGELNVSALSRNIDGLRDVTQGSDVFKARLRSIMRTQLSETQHPLVTNVKQGLQVVDKGDNSVHNIAKDQVGRGIFDEDELEAVQRMPTEEANLRFREMLQEQGYDHLVYVNSAEDKGVLSLVLFNEANYENVLKPTRVRKGDPVGHKAAVGLILSPLAAILGLDDGDIR